MAGKPGDHQARSDRGAPALTSGEAQCNWKASSPTVAFEWKWAPVRWHRNIRDEKDEGDEHEQW